MKRILLLLLIIVGFNFSYSQQINSDSLILQLDTEISDSLRIEILKKLAFSKSSQLQEKSKGFIERAIKISKEKQDGKFYLNTLLDASKFWRVAGDYEKSVFYGFSALKIADSLSREIDIAKASKLIGISYYRLQNFTEALKFHKKALDIYSQKKDSGNMANCFINMGAVYDESTQLDTALLFYNKALFIYEKFDNLPGMADSYNNIAGIYYQKRDNKNIIDYINKALDINRKMNDSVGISFTLINVGGVYNQIGDFKKGVESVKEGILIAQKINILPIENHGYKTLFEIYEKNKDYKNAFEFYKLYTSTKDSLTNIKKVKNINEIQTKYETEKKNVQIKELKIQTIKDENTQKIFQIAIGTLIIIAILLIIFFVQRGKINKVLNDKNEQLKELNSTQNRLMSIISHDFKAPLSAFYSITNSLKNKFSKLEKAEIDNYFTRMLNSSIALKMQLENMLNWAINQSRQIVVDKSEFNLHILSFKTIMILQEFANEKSIIIENEISEDIEITTDGRLLSIVLNNLITNAVKFSKPKSKIVVSAKKENDKITISVKDFGMGMSKNDAENLFSSNKNISKNENSGTGLGLVVSKDIIEKLKGKISVKSELQKGTEFFIEL